MGHILSSIWQWVAPVVQIGVLTFILYRFHSAVQQTKAQQIARIMMWYVALYILSSLLHLEMFLYNSLSTRVEESFYITL